MTLNELRDRAYLTNLEKGFWEGDNKNIPSKLALIHAEVSEALEDYRERKDVTYLEGEKPCGFPNELADVVIRVADLCGHLGIDLDGEVERKLEYNLTRPIRHGNKRC